jgi:Fe2+ transport system protein FeoA
MFSRWLRRSQPIAAPAPQPVSTTCASTTSTTSACDDCVATCPLAHCRSGHRAVVVRVDCASADACRLRALGIYEGARVDVLDSRNGLLLQVRGSRLALGAAVAASIAVIPVA